MKKWWQGGGSKHRGSIRASHPAAPGSALGVTKNFILHATENHQQSRLESVDRGFIIPTEPIWHFKLMPQKMASIVGSRQRIDVWYDASASRDLMSLFKHHKNVHRHILLKCLSSKHWWIISWIIINRTIVGEYSPNFKKYKLKLGEYSPNRLY